MSGFEKLDDELGDPEEEKRIREEIRKREEQQKAERTAANQVAKAGKSYKE